MKVREKATKHLKKVETSKKPKYPWADSSEKEKKEVKERKREQSNGDVVETSHDQLLKKGISGERKKILDMIIIFPILGAGTLCKLGYSTLQFRKHPESLLSNLCVPDVTWKEPY